MSCNVYVTNKSACYLFSDKFTKVNYKAYVRIKECLHVINVVINSQQGLSMFMLQLRVCVLFI